VNVYDHAHALARALKESPEYKSYMEVKARVSENEELSASLNDFQQKQFQIQAAQMMGGESDDSMMEQVQELAQILMRDPLAAQYMQAEISFTMMFSDVYKILQEAIGTWPNAE
jgi:cell fate (sporulation/competence/biofilm development) regulator YlbF (YheA/YmcA/DUF963 family)